MKQGFHHYPCLLLWNEQIEGQSLRTVCYGNDKWAPIKACLHTTWGTEFYCVCVANVFLALDACALFLPVLLWSHTHHSASCCYRLQTRMMKTLGSGILLTSNSLTYIVTEGQGRRVRHPHTQQHNSHLLPVMELLVLWVRWMGTSILLLNPSHNGCRSWGHWDKLPPLDLRSYQCLAQLLEKELSPLELPSVSIWVQRHPDDKCIVRWDVQYVEEYHKRPAEGSSIAAVTSHKHV